jgi:hypothetical protein
MTNPTPTGDHFPGQTYGGEQPSQWSGNTTPAYDAPPQYQPYPPQNQSYQQPHQSAGAPPYSGYPPAGAPPYPGYPPQYAPGMAPTNPFAIASLIVSLVGFGLIGVILGHVALGQIKRSNGYEQGRGLAIAGLIIGYAQLAIILLFALGFAILMIAASTTTPTN